MPPKTDVFVAGLDPTPKQLKHLNTVIRFGATKLQHIAETHCSDHDLHGIVLYKSTSIAVQNIFSTAAVVFEATLGCTLTVTLYVTVLYCTILPNPSSFIAYL